MQAKIGYIGITLAAAALLAAAYSAFRASQAPKIGIVDNSMLLQQFSEAIRAREEMQAERTKWQGNSKIIEDSLKAVIDALGKSENSGPKIRGELTVRLDKWNKEYNDYSSAVQRMTPKMEAEKLKPVLDKLNMFVQTWGAEHGFDVILGTGTGGVILMRNGAKDVTSQVLTGLNALYKRGSISSPVSGDSASSRSVNDSSKAQSGKAR